MKTPWSAAAYWARTTPTLSGRVLRGQSEALARQEVGASLLVHNTIATLAARVAAQAGIDPTKSASPPCPA